MPSATSRAASSAPVAAIASHTLSACSGVRTPRRSSPASSGSRSRARISGSVTVPSSRSVPRCLPVRSAGPLTSSTSSSSWNASPMRSPNSPSSATFAAAGQRAQLAGGAEQPRGLEIAAAQVALTRRLQLPRVLALQQLALDERGGGVREHPHRLDRAAARELGERAREQQVAGRGGDRAPGGGHDRRPAAPQHRGVEHVVVDQRGRVHQLDRNRRAQRRVAARRIRPRGHEHQQRAQPLAARGDRRAGVLAERRAVRVRRSWPGAPRGRASARGRALPLPRRPRRPPRRSPRYATVPWWIAMIPPAVRIQPHVAAARGDQLTRERRPAQGTA